MAGRTRIELRPSFLHLCIHKDWYSVGLTDLTLSCAAGPACRSRSGAPVAAIKMKQRDANCNRRDAAALAARKAARLPGRSRAAPASA
jgi:hypothetical protein